MNEDGFRAWLRGLPTDVANARLMGLPVTIEGPLPEHAVRLMATLGVEVTQARSYTTPSRRSKNPSP